MREKILVVAPHADDETLGCGGTLLKSKVQGDKLYWMLVTRLNVHEGWSHVAINKRQREIEKVSKMYGFEKTFSLDFPAKQLDKIPFSKIVLEMSNIIQVIKPTIVYVPNHSDIHTDHQITFNAIMSCCKNFRSPFIRKVLMYECISETEFAPALGNNVFVPNVFVDISSYLVEKIKIFKTYESEVMKPPLPRSVEIITRLAEYRGSRITKRYAEAFYLLFEKVC